MLPANWIARWAGCLAVLSWVATSIEAKAAPAPSARTHHRVEAKVPTFEFRMDNVPWKSVLEWIRDHTRKPVVCTAVPTGCFTFVPPWGTRLTMSQILTVVNNALRDLETGPYLVIERTRNFVLVPADEPIDPELFLPN